MSYKKVLLAGALGIGLLSGPQAMAAEDDGPEVTFTSQAQTALADGSVCVAGGETEDFVDSKSVVLVKKNGAVRQRIALPLPDPNYSDARAMACLQKGEALYVVEELDTSSIMTDKRTLLFVDRIEHGRLQKRVMLPVRYSGQNFGVARVGARPSAFMWDAAGQLVVSGKVYRDALGGKPGKAFTVKLQADLTVAKS